MWFSHVVCLIISVACDDQLLSNNEEAELRKELGLYKNLEEVENIFQKDANPIAQKILKAFHTECLYTEEPVLPTENRKPFIVIEGNHRASKEAIGQKLASLLDGRYLTQVAPCLRRFAYKLRGGHPLRRPLQFLSLYASAFDARVQMTLNRAVVINNYWTELLSFSATQSFHSCALPPITADFLLYPEDLMQPDLHIFLDFGEALYTTTPATHMYYQINNVRRTSNLKKRKLEFYRHLQTRLPFLIHHLQRVSNRVTAVQLLEQVRANLSSTRDFDTTLVSCEYADE